MSLNYKITQCLEWCTKIPLKDQSQQSPVFLLQGNEWFFKFFRTKDLTTPRYSVVYLLLKKRNSELKKINVGFRVGFKSEQTLSLAEGEFEIAKSKSYEVWIMPVNLLAVKLPPDYMDGNWIKFMFYFNDVAEPLIKVSKDRDNKAVQTPLYMDSNFLLESISKDFSTLFDDGPRHDIEFVCGDKIIKAHKNITCCRSKVFESMIRSHMEEGKTGQVIITDIESSILHHFLRYLHTGVLPELTVDTTLRFYEAADKYGVDTLKKHCATFLTENLSHENACEILIMSDRHSDSDFKKDVVEYMMKEKIPRHIGKKWTDFCRQNQTLANEVLNFLYQHCCRKYILPKSK